MHSIKQYTTFFVRDISRKVILLILFSVMLIPDITSAQSHEDWTYNLGIYEVNIRQYTEEGTFAAFEEHLDRLEEMGVGILWFMPIHPIGEKNRKGSLGSYYSVKDFRDVNPEFGTPEDFKRLVHEIHKREMYAIIDWVPNHSAWDNYLTELHPEWYVTNEDGDFISPPGTDWDDVIQFDFSQPGLFDYMLDAKTFWVEEFGVDGFRFDAVSFVEDEFWEKTLVALKEVKPDIFLLAEGDGPKWHDLGFDMSFGWDLYGFERGMLVNIVDSSYSANEMHNYILGQQSSYPENAYRMYFTSNHDENSWHGTTSELFGDAAESFAVLTAVIPGMPLIYNGQEAGLDYRLEFFEKDEIIWQDHEKEALYATLLHLKKRNRALWNGAMGGSYQRISTSNDEAILAFLRTKESDRIFAAFNLSDQEQRVSVSVSGSYVDIFTEKSISFDGETTLTLAPWGYVVYESTD